MPAFAGTCLTGSPGSAWRRCLSCGSEGHAGADELTADTADDAGGAHGHGDHRGITVLLLHGQRCVKQSQDIPLTLRHHREFHDISAQGLHQAEIAYDDVLIRRCGKVVAGSDDFHTDRWAAAMIVFIVSSPRESSTSTRSMRPLSITARIVFV